MLPLLLAGIVFFFLVLGSIVFVGMAGVPKQRRYALSGALWVAMLGPCVAALFTFAMLVMVAGAAATEITHGGGDFTMKLFRPLGWPYLVIGLASSCVVASAASWLHQKIIQRLPFALFRLYAAVVAAGIGSVFGWCLCLTCADFIRLSIPAWAAFAVILIAVFAVTVYRFAALLRNELQPWFTPKPSVPAEHISELS